ncbi:hypothetical protein [Rhodococcus sp. KRD162]|jgi:hypothetical protein|uniref:hypothetical protein n=1 Tax=Rhodococcus sp. KRD162 TaxID=2729725 RepID=UPI0019D02C52|nr:hypothetical protein [Rhodococcus sp. KRD162]
MTSTTVSKDAEVSRNLINDTLAAHQESIDAITAHGSRPRRLPATRVDRVQIQRQATLIRFLSITESFCTARLLTEIASLIPNTVSDHAAVQAMWDDSHDRATGSWNGIRDAYYSWLAVPRKTWTQLLDLTNARNAVAHGHGHLTWKQQRGNRTELEDKLSKHKITVAGTRLVLTEETIAHVAQFCRGFILELDTILKDKKAALAVAAATT